MPNLPKIHAKIIVEGIVQGVSFRAYTRKKARQLDLTGYVKNLRNGNVRIEVEGIQKEILKLIDWVKNQGSPASTVTNVKVEWQNELENYSNFRIAY
ncbi:MAG: acylphosphatase [Asgard group archaeon]|nr:acylphosphatase [Asgard group archaeon]